MTMLLLPNYPALHYFYQKATISNADVSVESSNSLIGDLTYLSAISKRAEDVEKDEQSPAPPSKSHKEVTSFTYLLSGLSTQFVIKSVTIRYTIFSEQLTEIYLPVNNPPPQFL
jgi:hypothetical protein